MTCIAPSENIFHSDKYFNPIPERISWVRKHHIENEFYSDEELHPDYHEKQSLDRLKEIQDLSMRATLLNAEHRYSEEPITPRKRRLTAEFNSPDRNEPYYPVPTHDEGRYKLTLSQFASSASEQEPLYPDDEDVEEILMRLRHGHDYYRPQASAPHAPSFPLLFPPNQMRPAFYPCIDPHQRLGPLPPPNKGSLFHILSQEPEHHHPQSHHMNPHHPPHPHHPHHHPLPHHMNPHQLPPHHPHHPMHPANNMHMRKLFFEEGIVESSDHEQDLEHPKKKMRRDGKLKSPLKSIVVSSNDDVQEKETIASGVCFKTHKPKVQREYYYAKLSKTIFRWTCCGSQAKTHPDA